MFLGDLWQNLLSDLYPGAAVLLLFAFSAHLPTPHPTALWCLILYSGTEACILPYSYLSLNKSHLQAQSAHSDLGFNKGSEGQSAGKIL